MSPDKKVTQKIYLLFNTATQQTFLRAGFAILASTVKYSIPILFTIFFWGAHLTIILTPATTIRGRIYFLLLVPIGGLILGLTYSTFGLNLGYYINIFLHWSFYLFVMNFPTFNNEGMIA